MSFKKQIDALTKKRNALLDAMGTASDLALAETRSFTAEEQTQFDKDQAELKDIDGQLDRLLAAEASLGRRADPAPGSGGEERGQVEVKTFKPFPGQLMTRYIATLARSKGNLLQAVELAKRWDNETPEVGAILRAAVASGTTSDPTWAGPLVNYTVMAQDFIDFLRPQTILGKLQLRPAPFMIKIPRQTAGISAQWVGEGASKPVGQLNFDMLTLPFAKMSVICVITDELARLSNPAAEMLVRDDLVAAIAQYSDQQFIDPAIAPAAGVRPGSVTNGNHVIAASGTSVAHVTADLANAMLWFSDNNLTLARPMWIMHTHAYQFLYTQRSSVDTFVWKDEMNQGKLMGIPFVVSNNVPIAAGLSAITLLDQNEILLADDGQVMIDTSAEASLQMDTAPVTPPAAATVMVSMFQQNMLAVRAERYLYWLLRRAFGTTSITGFPAAAA